MKKQILFGIIILVLVGFCFAGWSVYQSRQPSQKNANDIEVQNRISSQSENLVKRYQEILKQEEEQKKLDQKKSQ